jgi:hypothetical protein
MAMNYEDTCVITCTDNDKVMKGEILDFKEGKSLSVTLNRQVKIMLFYDVKAKKYIGHQAGLEFTTDGPKGHAVRNGRG